VEINNTMCTNGMADSVFYSKVYISS